MGLGQDDGSGSNVRHQSGMTHQALNPRGVPAGTSVYVGQQPQPKAKAKAKAGPGDKFDGDCAYCNKKVSLMRSQRLKSASYNALF